MGLTQVIAAVIGSAAEVVSAALVIIELIRRR
jgi:hypothetical protein